MNELQFLFEKLNALRAGKLNIHEFKSCLNSLNEPFLKLISRSNLLKMKHGDMEKIMSVATIILPSCVKCNRIFKKGEFSNRSEHARCVVEVNKALKNNVLLEIIKPDWYQPSPGQLGVDVYYKCYSCNAIWELVEPERHCHGLWDRIA